VLTLSRELGAGDTGFAPTLASRLGLRVYDRELLEQAAVRLGVPESAREEAARKLIAQTDAQRRQFYESYFGTDWSSPLEYHLTVNSGRLGPAAVDLITDAAERYWKHAGQRT
jgi:cytidylate kinase